MRNIYRNILKQQFYKSLRHARAISGLTQAEMAERLAMDERSYSYIEHGESSCSAVTLVLFLIYVCDDPAKFLEDLRTTIELQIHQPV